MNVTVNAKVLSEALGFVGKSISSRPSHPVLGCVLVKAEGSQLQLTGFDLSTALIKTIDCEIIHLGAVAIPFQMLNNIVARLSGGINIVANYDEEQGSTTIKIKSDTGEYSIQGMDASEYPELPSCTNEPLQLPSDVLAQGLACTVQFASTEETKQILTGVHITLKGNDVEFASTDGHRLAVVRFKVTETLEPFTITLPSKALASLSKIEGDTVELSVSETNAQFKCGDAILICRSLDGSYPNYPQLIPNQFSRTATVEKRALAGALDRLSVLADPKNSVVYIDLSSTSLLASVESKDVGNGQETIPAESNISDIFRIAFNNKYMLEGLKVVSGEVKLQFNENNQPFIIQPVERLNFTYLVMPVQIR